MKITYILLILLFAANLPAQNLQLLAHYPLTTNTTDSHQQSADAKLINAPIRTDGVYLGGNYGSFDSDDRKGTLLSMHVAGFNPKDFSITFNFKLTERVNTRMNLMSLSRSCRYLNIYLNEENEIGLKLSNGRLQQFSDQVIEVNSWYQVMCTYNDLQGKAKLYINNSLVLSVDYRPDFTICGSTTDWSTTDFGNANSFKGYLNDWRAFNQAANPKELNNFLLDYEEGLRNEDIDDTDKDEKKEYIDDKDEKKEDIDDTEITTGLRQKQVSVTLSHEPFSYPQIAARPDGYAYLAWNENKKDAISTFGKLHLTTLDKDFNKVGTDLLLGDYEVRQVMAIDNQYIYLIVGERKDNKFTEWYKYDYLEANILYFMKIDRSGTVLFKTTLLGNEGQGPGKIWADNGFGTRYETKLAFNGTHFALYTGIRRNFAKQPGTNDVHEGDLFMLIDQNGKVLADKTQRWYSSHAFYLKLAVNDKSEFLTANLGDAYPVGILVRNRATTKNTNVWPPEKVTYQSGKTWYFAAGRLGELLEKDNTTFLLHAASQKGESQRGDKLDVLFLKLNENMEVQQKIWLTNTSQNNEQYVYAGWLGNQIIVAYSAYDSYKISHSKLMLINQVGEKSIEAIDSKLAFDYSSSHFVPFPDGSLVITKTDRSAKVIQVLKVNGK